MQNQAYHVLAYYHFVPIDNPQAEVAKHQVFIKGLDIRCRIYISEEGINGQMSALASDGEKYIAWLQSDTRFAPIPFKIHTHHEHVFPRAIVKYRKQIVALDEPVDMSQRGRHVSAAEWKRMLEARDDKTLLIDVRNDYEWKVGHFEGAELPSLEMFREFPEYARKLKETHDPKETKVMMYCTGGIRCELYSALLKKEGFEEVFQLEGGVINYGLKEGSEHWKGKLFVFDDRVCVPISGEEASVVGECLHCGIAVDVYYNCANMDCNELFLSCAACAEKRQGCCSTPCETAPRLRAFEKSEKPKPFQRAHHYKR